MKQFFHIFLLSTACSTYLHAPLATGDPNAATGETFSFNVGFAKFSPRTDSASARLWIASNDPSMSTYADTVKPYGLSYIEQLASYIPSNIVPAAIPMANQEDAVIYSFNGTTVAADTAPNPIWGAQFSFFDLTAEKPIFVIASEPSKLYAVQDLARYATQTEQHKNITNLLVYDFIAGNNIRTIAGSLANIYLAHSVTPFGTDSSSKIALLTRTALERKPYLSKLADTTISVSTPALTAAGAALTALGTSVTISPLFKNQQPYIGVDATAAGGGCAVALTTASIDAITPKPTSEPLYDFSFTQIAPTAVLNPGYNTVVSATAGNRVRITNVTGMITSTTLTYIIVARDNGTGPQSIYALPAVSPEYHNNNAGLIADFTHIHNVFSTKPLLFSSRYFNTTISDPTQIDPAGTFSTQLLVGAGAIPLDAPNSIQSLYTVGDSVYVVIGNPYTSTQSPGTFCSKALFAADGHIVGWTMWTRVLGTDKQMNYSSVSSNTISGFYVGHATTDFRAVYQTTFTNASNLAPFLTVAQSATGGIQGLFDFPKQTNGFANSISLLISTGYGNLTIGQTGALNSGIFEVKSMSTSDVVSFSGETINNHRSLIAAEIAHDGTGNHWIFTGGATGVSVLSDNTHGYTWNGTLPNIAALTAAGQNWKKIGNFSSVKKLIWDETFLYVLTGTELYQIALDPSKFISPSPATLNQRLITTSSEVSNDSFFLDLIIDTGFCVIGTTNGLFTLDVHSGQINQITIPDGLPCASQLIASSSSSQPQRSFATLSNLTVLNNSFGTQQARINRFVIENSVVTPFHDFLAGQISSDVIEGNKTSLIRFNDYINSYFTDGSWNLASSYFMGPNQQSNTQATPFVQQLFAGISAGKSSSHIILPLMSAYAPLIFLRNALNLAWPIRESTSGSLLIAGNFAAQANA